MVSKHNTATNSYHIHVCLYRVSGFHENPNFCVTPGVKLSMETGAKNILQFQSNFKESFKNLNHNM